MPGFYCCSRQKFVRLVRTLLVAIIAISAITPAAAHRPLPPPEFLLDPADYVTHKPNELGRIPVMMYHNIVPNDFDASGYGQDPYMFRTFDQFWNDMLWLYEHDFYLIGMKDLISGNIDIPLGKHPVVFTFDDGTSYHFSVIPQADGSFEINPESAVGLMEKFYAQYPDFGRGAHFGISPGNMFSWPAMNEDDYFDYKLQWLMENGYEVGNHTQSHADLSKSDAEEFAWTVGKPVLWGDQVFGRDSSTNCMRVLTLPFGIYPTQAVNPVANAMLRDGFQYEGQPIHIEAVLHLAGGSSLSVWDVDYDAFHIPRLPVQDDVMANMYDAYLNGGNVYYTSDGKVDAVTVPWPPPEILVGKLNPDAVAASGKQLVRYHPEDGKVYPDRKIGIHAWIRGL